MPPQALLPKQTDDFHSKQYWQTFFERRGDESFEWYGSYAELRAIVVDDQKLRRTDRVLVVGCGNSDFSAELYDDGYEEVTNVDFEATVISAMAARNESRTKMSWLVADMTAMVEVATGAVDVVFDKGALDALASSDTPAVRAQVDRFFAEVKRVLAPRGRYVCVSLAQEHITRWWVDGFARGAGRWRTAAHANARAAKQSPYLPFVLVAASPRAASLPRRPGGVARWFTSTRRARRVAGGDRDRLRRRRGRRRGALPRAHRLGAIFLAPAARTEPRRSGARDRDPDGLVGGRRASLRRSAIHAHHR